MDDGFDELAAVLGRAPARFEVQRRVLEPGTSHRPDHRFARDGIVLVGRGTVEVEDRDGHRERFPRGSILWLAGVGARSVNVLGPDPAELLVVARRRPPVTPRRSPVQDELGYYRDHSPFTDPGGEAGWVDGVPADLATLHRVAHGLVFHYRANGDLGHHGFGRDRLGEIDLRYADLQLARLRELADGPIDAPRAPTQRILGCCRDSAVLFTSLARQAGLPARVRVGFAGYFEAGWYLDHVVAEVWDAADQRWRLVDPDLDPSHTDPSDGGIVNVLDVPRDRFLVGPSAWQLARDGGADPERFVVAPDLDLPFLRGLPYLAHNLVFDLAALNRVELLLWDRWGLLLDEAGPDEPVQARLDGLAEALNQPDRGLADVRALFEADDVRVPDQVITEAPPIPTTTRLRRR